MKKDFEYNYCWYLILEKLPSEMPIELQGYESRTVASELSLLMDSGYVSLDKNVNKLVRTELGKKYFEWMQPKVESIKENSQEWKDKVSKIKKLLKSPNLFTTITEKELSKKIVGEKDTIKTIFLCAMGSKVENAKKTSYNLLVNDETGSGKDWVTEHVLEILPKEQWIKRTRISEKAFTYWHNPKFEPEWTWDGKIFYNEDISSNVLNSDVFKVMASTGSKATILINQTPVDIEIKGKPIIIVTTESANPSRENIRRFTIVNLDTSVDQTKAIMQIQAKASAKGISIEYDERIIEALSHIKRAKVKIPYAEKLLDFFPSDHVIMRTHFDRFLDYIKASAVLYQYQRKTDKEGFLLATGKDYDIARSVLLKTTSNKYMIPLTKDQRKILEIMKNLPRDNYTVDDLTTHITFMSDRWLRRQLDKLTNYGFLKKDNEIKEYSDKRVLVYSYIDIFDIDIPKWDSIKKRKNRSNRSSNTNRSNGSNPSNPLPKPNEKQMNEMNEMNGELKGKVDRVDIITRSSLDNLHNQKDDISSKSSEEEL